MTFGHFSEQRKKVFERVVEFVEKEGSVQVEQLLAEMQITYGITKENAEKYLNTCVEADELTIDNDEVVVSD